MLPGHRRFHPLAPRTGGGARLRRKRVVVNRQGNGGRSPPPAAVAPPRIRHAHVRRSAAIRRPSQRCGDPRLHPPPPGHACTESRSGAGVPRPGIRFSRAGLRARPLPKNADPLPPPAADSRPRVQAPRGRALVRVGVTRVNTRPDSARDVRAGRSSRSGRSRPRPRGGHPRGEGRTAAAGRRSAGYGTGPAKLPAGEAPRVLRSGGWRPRAQAPAGARRPPARDP